MKPIALACALVVAATTVPAAADANAAAALRARALEFGYNLDHDEALATLRAAIAADPDAAAGYRLAAATIWIKLLFEQGAVTVEDFLGQARADVPRSAPSTALAADFREYLQRARTIAEQRVRDHPRDADAHFQLGATFGFEASYIATIEGRVFASTRPARRAYAEHTRALELSPGRTDAGLIVGMYRCAVAELSMLPRLFAYLSGFDGDRQIGLRLVEEAARHPSEVQPNALFTLMLLYNRGGRYDDALQVIQQLQARYPRNRLLWLEAGGTALRAKRYADARRWLEEGLAKAEMDRRPKAPGEMARWQYAYGATLVALHDRDGAERALRDALGGATRDWIRGRVHRELAKLADLAGDRRGARAEYELAISLCHVDRDSACVEEARTLLKTPYR